MSSKMSNVLDRVALNSALSRRTADGPADSPSASITDCTRRTLASSVPRLSQPGSAKALSTAPFPAANSADLREPLPQRLQEFVGAGPASPLVCRHTRLVAVKVLDEAGASDPATPDCGVHKLQPATQLTPDHHEMRAAAGMANDDQRGQRSCVGLEQMLRGQHHLLRVDTELIGDCLDRVDRRTIDVGLAGFAQPSIADRNAESFQQAFQRCGSAVHRRDLDDLGHKKSA